MLIFWIKNNIKDNKVQYFYLNLKDYDIYIKQYLFLKLN